MLHITNVLGDSRTPRVAAQLHDLSHRGAVDVVDIAAVDLARRRLRATTRGGVELAIALPRSQKLYHGAILLIEMERAIVVHAIRERWLRLDPRTRGDAIALGYHAGNLHWRVRFDGEVLFVALEAEPETYLVRLDGMIEAGRVAAAIVEDEPGDTGELKTGHGHAHGSSHSHGHGLGHAHDHGDGHHHHHHDHDHPHSHDHHHAHDHGS